MHHHIFIDDTTIDTLTVKFWMDRPGPKFIGPVQPMYACNTGSNMIEGSAGFGLTPLAALRDLCENIARDEGIRADRGILRLR